MMRNAPAPARFLHKRPQSGVPDRIPAGFLQELAITWKVWLDIIPI